MKHLPLGLALAGLLFSASPALAQPISVVVDGTRLQFDQPPIMDQGRVLVPLRGIFEALGAKVEYSAGLIRATRGTQSIEVRLGSRQALVSGQTVTLDAPARSVAGRTLVPLRFVAEALGAEVGWNGSARQVSVKGDGAVAGGPTGQPTPTPTPTPGPPANYGFHPATDLKRIMVGNQAGLLKIFRAGSTEVEFFRAIDDRSLAPVRPEHRSGVYAALKIPQSAVDQAALHLMNGFAGFKPKEDLAMLGLLGSDPAMSESTRSRVRGFLAAQMTGNKDVTVRRQATLSLALMQGIDASSLESVLRLYETSDNLWETFPVQQYFEYHGNEIRALPQFATIQSRVSRVNSLYTANLLTYLSDPSVRQRGLVLPHPPGF